MRLEILQILCFRDFLLEKLQWAPIFLAILIIMKIKFLDIFLIARNIMNFVNEPKQTANLAFVNLAILAKKPKLLHALP
jgi:hypothetical protein